MVNRSKSAPGQRPPEYSESSPLMSDAEHHEKYFFEDDYAVLLVERKLFRVSARWLELNSPRFKKIRQEFVSSSPEHPIPVPDVRAAELETLLDFIEESMKDGFAMSMDQWTNLLSIAYKLDLKSIKPRAVAEVFMGGSPPDPIQQLVLYEAYDVPRSNLSRAMYDLIVRPNTMIEDELMKLSYKTIAEVLHLREDYIRSQLKPFGQWPGTPEKCARALVAHWVEDGV